MDGSVALGIGIGLGLAALGTGIGQGLAVYGAVQGIARQPEANNKIFIPMIVGLALIESLLILCFVVLSGLSGKVPTPEAPKAATMVHTAPKTVVASMEARSGFILY